jgi:hypothetical protein
MATQNAGDRNSVPPSELIDQVRDPSRRKLHLVAYQFMRQTFGYLWSPPAQWRTPPFVFEGKDYLPELREALESLERFADNGPGCDGSQDAAEVWTRVKEAAVMCREFEFAAFCRDCMEAGSWARAKPVITNVRDWLRYDLLADNVPPRGSRASREAVKVALIHEVFGPSLGPITVDPDWCTDTAVTLATQMYESRDFSAMPILADALQDAGCDDERILDHCRDPNATHVRGCWCVDLVLGKA